jgi:rhodanese-related sulfurtransferase
MNIVIPVITLFLILFSETAYSSNWKYILPQSVHAMTKDGSGLWLVDVRNPTAFEKGHIEGGVNIPSEQLKMKTLPKNKIIVLADDSLGLRHARIGAEVLLKKGHEKVFIMEGGIPAWEKEKLPVAGSRIEIFRPVSWDDLSWAQSSSLAYKLYDLRDDAEKDKGPVQGVISIKGKTLEERLKTLIDQLTQPQKKGLVAKLEKTVPIILVTPNVPASLDTIRMAVKGVREDIRYLDGAYPLWVAHEKHNPLPGPEVCPTCPSGKKVTK